jgi:WD40 repeat protein
VALSPNGQRLAAAVPEGNAAPIHVFDAVSGKEAQVLTEPAGPVRSLSFLTDNRTILSAGLDKVARLLDHNVVTVLDAHPGGVVGATWHTTPTQVVSAGADKAVKLWDLNMGKAVRGWGPLPEPITSLALSKDGTLVAAGAGKSVKVWNSADGKDVASLTCPAEVLSVSFSADKARVAVGLADNHAQVLDLATGQLVQFFGLGGPVKAVAYHPGNASIITGSADKSVTVQTLALAKSVAVGSPVRGLAMTADGARLLTACDDKTVKVWTVGTGAKERDLPGAEGVVKTVAVSKNNVLAAASGADQTIRIYTLADGKLINSFKTGAPVRNLTFSPSSQLLAAGLDNNTLQTWNVVFTAGQPIPAEFGRPQQSFNHAGPVLDVTFTPDSGFLWSASADKTMRVWKSAGETAVRNFAHPSRVDAVAFSPDGKMLATGCPDGKVRIFDLAKGAVAKEISAHIHPQPIGPAFIYCLTWTPDSKQVFSGSYDHTVKLWDATTGAMVREFKGFKEKEFEKGHRDGVFSMALSPDGKTLATGSSDRTIKLWNLADGSVVRELVNPNLKGPHPLSMPGWVYGVRFTPDGKGLIAASGAPKNQGALAVWNLADGKLLSAEEMPLGTFFSMALTADGQRLALGVGGVGRAAAGEEVNTSWVLKAPKGP